jgi:hypothetical protein
MRTVFLAVGGVVFLVSVGSCGRQSVNTSTASPRTVTVAESGTADVIGSDSATLQWAADQLKLGDTLGFGPGTYSIENSLRIPTG